MRARWATGVADFFRGFLTRKAELKHRMDGHPGRQRACRVLGGGWPPKHRRGFRPRRPGHRPPRRGRQDQASGSAGSVKAPCLPGCVWSHTLRRSHAVPWATPPVGASSSTPSTRGRRLTGRRYAGWALGLGRAGRARGAAVAWSASLPRHRVRASGQASSSLYGAGVGKGSGARSSSRSLGIASAVLRSAGCARSMRILGCGLGFSGVVESPGCSEFTSVTLGVHDGVVEGGVAEHAWEYDNRAGDGRCLFSRHDHGRSRIDSGRLRAVTGRRLLGGKDLAVQSAGGRERDLTDAEDVRVERAEAVRGQGVHGGQGSGTGRCRWPVSRSVRDRALFWMMSAGRAPTATASWRGRPSGRAWRTRTPLTPTPCRRRIASATPRP